LKNKDFSKKPTPFILKTLTRIKVKRGEYGLKLSENSENSIRLCCEK